MGVKRESVLVNVPKNDKLQVSDDIFLDPFDLSGLDPRKGDGGKRVLIIGGSGSGKTTVVKNIMKVLYDIPVWNIYSPTEKTNGSFGPHVHPLWIHNDLELSCLYNVRKRQEFVAKKWSIPGTFPVEYKYDISVANIYDDCNIEPKLFKDEIFNWVYFNSRHSKVLNLMLMQYATMLPIQHRRNLSHIFISRQSAPKEIEKLYNEFGGCFAGKGGRQVFEKALTICTNDRRFMVIDVLNPSPHVQDKIKFFKADPNLGPFKCGADWAWKQSDEMYNPEWEDIWMQNLEMQDPMDPKGKNKGKKQAAATKKNPGDINIHLVDNNKNIIA